MAGGSPRCLGSGDILKLYFVIPAEAGIQNTGTACTAIGGLSLSRHRRMPPVSDICSGAISWRLSWPQRHVPGRDP